MMENIFEEKGFEIVEEIYSEEEVNKIISIIDSKEKENLFGVREFLKKNPDLMGFIFNKKLLNLIKSISPTCKSLIKSIYFDKPPNANWIVNWHQDLTINLKTKKEIHGFKNWRIKYGRVIVQPSLSLLKNIFTIRIHLDNCTKENGALRVIEKSHKKGIIEIKDWIKNKNGLEKICEIKKGGILIMKPLILHASKRTENQKNRRVIHIEFCKTELPQNLEWKEEISFA